MDGEAYFFVGEDFGMNDQATFTLGALQQNRATMLSYRLRVPAPQQPQRCLVLLHGVGSNETHLLSLADGVGEDTLVVFVQGPLQLGIDQFAWFRVTFTPLGPSIVPQEADASRQLLIRLLAQLQSQYQVVPQRTVIAGFSQGGIMSASVGLSSPHSVAGFGLLSGRILPELEPSLATPAQLAGLKAFVGHGEHDSKLPVSWAHKSERLLQDLGIEYTMRLYPIDHTISPSMCADFWQWLKALS